MIESISFIIIGWIAFGNAGVGALIGLGIVIFFGLRMFSENLSGDYNGLLYNAYRLTTAPLFYTNRWQHILSAPWRYILKTGPQRISNLLYASSYRLYR